MTVNFIVKKIHKNEIPTLGRVGKYFQYDREEILAWMAEKGLEPQCNPDKLGKPQIVVPDGDELLTTQQVAEMIGIKRSWFQTALSKGLIPPPDDYPQRPHPSRWLRSTIVNWINEADPRFTYKTIEKNAEAGATLLEVYTIPDMVCLGQIQKKVLRERFSRVQNRPTFTTIYGWVPVGIKTEVLPQRRDAARWLYRAFKQHHKNS